MLRLLLLLTLSTLLTADCGQITAAADRSGRARADRANCGGCQRRLAIRPEIMSTRPRGATFEGQLRKVFESFDADGGGSISIDELGEVMNSLGQACTDAELLVGHMHATCIG
jgi:hypothetical protein